MTPKKGDGVLRPRDRSEVRLDRAAQMAPAGIGAMRSTGGKSDRVPPAFTQAGETGAAKAVEQRCAAVVYEADPGCCEKRIRRVRGMKALLARGLRVWGA